MNEQQMIEQMIGRVGRQIANMNEFTDEKLNQLIVNSEEWLKIEEDEQYYSSNEPIFDLIMDEKFTITIADGTRLTKSPNYQCNLHKQGRWGNDEGREVFQVENSNLFICCDCNTLLKSHSDILNQYECTSYEADQLLFPVDWNENGIKVWCQKKQDRESVRSERYEQRREYMYQRNQELYCLSCNHWDEEDESCDKYIDQDECSSFR